MANAHARTHVVGPTAISASESSDLESRIENSHTLYENERQAIEDTQFLSRKERRKQKRQTSKKGELDVEEVQNPEPAKSSTTWDDESDELSDESARLSRKERRRLKKQQKQESDNTFNQPTVSSKHPNNPSKAHSHPTAVSIPLTLSSSMPPSNYYPLLVCSLGNPGAQYANTLHSAGHTLLNTIRNRGLYQPFKKSLSGLVATPNTTRYKYNIVWGFQKDSGERKLADGEDDFTLWQSTKLMNVSGPAVRNAWREFSAQQKAKGLEGRLVVIHDELESALGKVTIKEGTTSARGHNGLKSCQASLGGVKWWRIGIGIGRPESRDPAVVSQYVLRKMTYAEEKALDKASVDVLFALRKIAEGAA